MEESGQYFQASAVLFSPTSHWMSWTKYASKQHLPGQVLFESILDHSLICSRGKLEWFSLNARFCSMIFSSFPDLKIWGNRKTGQETLRLFCATMPLPTVTQFGGEREASFLARGWNINGLVNCLPLLCDTRNCTRTERKWQTHSSNFNDRWDTRRRSQHCKAITATS